MPAVPKPPRLTGNEKVDIATIIEWAWGFYRAIELEGAYAKATEVAALVDSVDGLTDPASGTVATAQATANNALIIANQQKARLDAMPSGEATIDDANTTVVVTLPSAQSNTSYFVSLTPQSSVGTPAAGAYTVTGVAKTTTDFTITISAAPGAGKSVTFAWQIQR